MKTIKSKVSSLPEGILTSKRSEFSLPKGITFLNGAYMSPLHKDVEKAGLRALRLKRNPISITPQDFYTKSDELRKEFAKLINAPDPQHIAIIPSVSYGMATVANNIMLRAGDEIIVATEQFPSNYYAWKKKCDQHGAVVKAIAPPDDFLHRGKRWNENILKSISSQTRVVAIGHIHWADGTLFDLDAIRARTKEVGALLIIDGTQSVGALPFDVQRLQPDALICAGYKWLLGPYGLGLAYYGSYFKNGTPIEENWIARLNSEDFSGLVNYQEAYQPGMLRYDMGERSNFINVPMLLKAIQQLNKWQPQRIQDYCKAISDEAVNILRHHDFIIEEDDARAHHLFGVRLPQHLSLEQTKERILRHKIYVSVRGNSIRVAPNVYNTKKDFDRLVKVLLKD